MNYNADSCPRGYITLLAQRCELVGGISNPTSLYYEDFKSDRQIVLLKRRITNPYNTVTT